MAIPSGYSPRSLPPQGQYALQSLGRLRTETHPFTALAMPVPDRQYVVHRQGRAMPLFALRRRA